VRGDQADFTKLQAIHDRTPFDLSVLFQRYTEEMGHVVINPRRLRGNFLALVESLFPEAVTLVEKALERPDQRSRLDAFLASQASLKSPRRSRRRPALGAERNARCSARSTTARGWSPRAAVRREPVRPSRPRRDGEHALLHVDRLEAEDLVPGHERDSRRQ
jgi:hypothetical protein